MRSDSGRGTVSSLAYTQAETGDATGVRRVGRGSGPKVALCPIRYGLLHAGVRLAVCSPGLEQGFHVVCVGLSAMIRRIIQHSGINGVVFSTVQGQSLLPWVNIAW